MSGWDDWRRVRGCERTTKTKRWKTHCWNLQHGSWSTGPSITLHNSSSSWGDTQTTYWNTQWTLCSRQVLGSCRYMLLRDNHCWTTMSYYGYSYHWRH